MGIFSTINHVYSKASPQQLLSWSSTDKKLPVFNNNHWHATNSLGIYFC